MGANNSEQIIRDSILKVGNVVSVDGRTVKIKVDKAKNVSHLLFNGETIKNISVGGYIKIRKGFEVIVGKIDGEYVTERLIDPKREYIDPKDKFERILEVKLVGFYDGRNFKKGIKEMPLIDNESFLLDKEEYKDVHTFVRDNDIPLEIGVLANDHGIPISLGVNSLFSSHIGIFGNTGSGKSYTLASLYNRLFKTFISSENFKENAHFILLDFNGEYVSNSSKDLDQIIAPPELKETYKLSTRIQSDKYPLALDVINDEILWIIAAEATEKTQVPFLRRSLKNSFIDKMTSDSDSFKKIIIDVTNEMTQSKNKEFLPLVNNFIKDLEIALTNGVHGISTVKENIATKLGYSNGGTDFIINIGGRTIYGDNSGFRAALEDQFSDLQINLNEMNVFTRIHTKLVLNFYSEIAKGYSNRDHIAPMMKRLEKRVQDLSKVIELENETNVSEKLLTIISLKDVNIHMRKVLPLLICKELYEAKKLEGDRTKYLNIIIDEAHNILSEASLRESEQWKDYRLETFEEIIKEGRKFGTFLTIASQRPYDISPTIISQLHNYFLHRLINEKDLKAVENTVSFLDKVSFESLPILPTGSCVLSGQVSQVPVIVEIGEISKEAQPMSETYRPTDYWAA